jgi:hypothetical protein
MVAYELFSYHGKKMDIILLGFYQKGEGSRENNKGIGFKLGENDSR